MTDDPDRIRQVRLVKHKILCYNKKVNNERGNQMKKYKILIVFWMLLLFPVVALADEDLMLPQYTEEYKNWLELSEQEKQEYIEPQAYEPIIETEEMLTQEFSSEVNVAVGNLPAQYQRKYYGSVKNQMSSNACWAYASASMFDINYYLVNNLTQKTFANKHMDYITSNQYNPNGFNRKADSGGNVQIALAYGTNGMGIALESSMPADIQASTITNVPTNAKVEDYIQLFNQDQIKNYINKYGILPVYTYISGATYFSSTNLIGNTDLAYCSPSTQQNVNHAVTLIGWDDNYTNSSFPNKKGAYIALNSYGPTFGNNGLYYIFYEDGIIQASDLYGATKTTDIDYDYLYQHDPYGRTAEAGYGTGTYAANVFQRQNKNYTENLTQISSYFPEAGNITIYINSKGSDVKTSSATKIINTTVSQAGYHTIKLEPVVELKEEKFVIGIKYPSTLSAEIPTPTGWCSTVTSNTGESYISKNGTNYTDMKQVFAKYGHANACIKAFTQKGTAIQNTNPVPEAVPNLPANKVNEYHDDLPNYVFDYRYYADHNFDLFQAFGYNEIALRNHWNTSGIREGRASSSLYDGKYYVANNADLRTAFANDYAAAYQHFLAFGYKEYRKSSPYYDPIYYRTHHQDLRNMTSMELIRHYANCRKTRIKKSKHSV